MKIVWCRLAEVVNMTKYIQLVGKMLQDVCWNQVPFLLKVGGVTSSSSIVRTVSTNKNCHTSLDGMSVTYIQPITEHKKCENNWTQNITLQDFPCNISPNVMIIPHIMPGPFASKFITEHYLFSWCYVYKVIANIVK